MSIYTRIFWNNFQIQFFQKEKKINKILKIVFHLFSCVEQL